MQQIQTNSSALLANYGSLKTPSVTDNSQFNQLNADLHNRPKLQNAYSDAKTFRARDRSISNNSKTRSQKLKPNSLNGVQAYGHLSSLNNGSPLNNKIKLGQGLTSSFSKST